jgi:hypothetical protein
MAIKIRDTNEYRIIDLFDNKMSDGLILEIEEAVGNAGEKRRIALNLLNLVSVTNNFIELLQRNRKKIALFNICPDTYSLLFITDSDKYTDLFTTEYDFIVNRRSLINRNLRLLTAAL